MADAGPVRRTEGGVTVALRVPVTAAPEDGKANAAVIALLARTWRVPRRAITVIRGSAARRKTIRVEGDPAALEAVIHRTIDGKG